MRPSFLVFTHTKKEDFLNFKVALNAFKAVILAYSRPLTTTLHFSNGI
jgi:hypothetical protein